MLIHRASLQSPIPQLLEPEHERYLETGEINIRRLSTNPSINPPVAAEAAQRTPSRQRRSSPSDHLHIA
jgi:hypothetical protein